MQSTLLVAIHALVASQLCLTNCSDESTDKLEQIAEHFTDTYTDIKSYTPTEYIDFIVDESKKFLDNSDKVDLPDHLTVLVFGAHLLNQEVNLQDLDKIKLILLSNIMKVKFNKSKLTPDTMVDYIHGVYIK